MSDNESDHSSDNEWGGETGEADEYSDGSSDDQGDARHEEESGGEQEYPYSAPPCCNSECLKKTSSKCAALVSSVASMTKQERITATLTSISLSAMMGDEKSTSTQGEERSRESFDYLAPIVGRVCREAFMHLFQISHRTLTIYRKRALLYSERRAGKGSNEVISMLHRVLQLIGVVTDPPQVKPKRLSV